MEYSPAIVAASFFAFALVSKRLGASWLTGTMLFVVLGLVIGPVVLGLVDLEGVFGRVDIITVLLTVTLVIVLFTDASAITSSKWHDDLIPARLLGIGLPLAIGLGWVAALLVLGDLEVWEAAVLATMLAPTDAALGKAVVSNPQVPARVRQALNIESGLNDGIALPVFLVFLEAARVAEDSLPVIDISSELAQRWGSPSSSVSASAGSERSPSGGGAPGDVLTIASFLVFGIYLGPVIADMTWQLVLYAVVSLAVVRLIAVAVALAGTRMRRASVLYIGWFGPRGLATIILTIEVIGETDLDGASMRRY